MADEEKKEEKKFRRTLLHKIVNVFIGIIAFILFLIIIFFGFSQTKTFRNYLKNQITENVNSSINGKLTIESLEGSILSSIIIHNVNLISENDTIVSAKEIVIKTSPIHLLLKRILIRDFILKNASLKLLENESGIWNLSRLSKGDGTPEDTVQITEKDSSDFPFSLQINNIGFENFNFFRQTYENRNSIVNHKYLDSEDLRLSNLNLSARLFANLSSSIVRFYLNNFSVKPNFEAFNLKTFSGEFELTQEYAQVRNLYLVSDSSNISIDAKIEELNLLGGVELKDFKEYPMSVKLVAYPINFSDLYTFIRDIDFLNGKVDLELEAQGYFGNFNVDRLNLAFLNSQLEANGNVQKLHTPENLFLDISINKSSIVETDAHDLVKGLDIPKYENLTLKNIEAKFKGEPTDFSAQISTEIGSGSIFLFSDLNLKPAQMEYDIAFNTKNLDLYPILNIPSSVTTNGTLTGKGTDPYQMDAFLTLNAFNSTMDSIQFDSLNLSSKIQSKLFDLDFNSLINGASTKIEGDLDLRNTTEPVYDLVGYINNLALGKFTGDKLDKSNLNITFDANGKNLSIDDMIGLYEVSLDSSYVGDLFVDSTQISLLLDQNNEERNIQLKSEFADFNINGKFSLEKALEIIVYEASTISSVINSKIKEINPIINPDSIVTENQDVIIPDIVNENLEFAFNFTFKDFELIAKLLKNDELDIVGTGEGTVSNDSLKFKISTDLNIDNLLNKTKNDIYYFSEVEANLNFSRDNRYVSFNKMFGTISLEGAKIYTGVEINNLELDLIFNQSKLFINSSLYLENELYTELEGIASTEMTNQRLTINNILLNYKELPWKNYDTTEVIFNEDGMQLSNLILENGSTVIVLNGQVNNDESHNLFIDIENMPGEVFSTYALSEETQPFGGDINLSLTSSGFLDNPDISLDLNLYDISYNNYNFGTLRCIANHRNFNTLLDIDFIIPEISRTKPLLTLDASIPLNIQYIHSQKLLEETSEILVSLRSNSFDIATFGNTLPYVKDQTGNLESVIDIKGPLNNLHSNGYILLETGHFTFRENNLDYGVSLKAELDDQNAIVEEFTLENTGGSRFTGKINGSGKMEMKTLPFNKLDFNFSGDLALLGKKSQTRNSNIYGDLFIQSSDNWKFKYDNDKYSFNGDVIVERAELVYVAQRGKQNLNNGRINYRILEDTTKINLSTQKFVRILNETRSNSIKLEEKDSPKFDLNTRILVNNIASLNFIVSPELGQKLNVLSTGVLKLETVGDEMRSQGSLSLLNGSTLDFFKTFDAVGTIRFESDLTDPHFDIVATYIGEISNFENLNTTEEVAVKLKLNTPFSKLQESISSNTQNLTVYVGRSNIENDVPDSRYDQSNALTFIILDQLSLDLNDEQKSTLGAMTENAAYSLLGSQLTSYLNSSLGGLISNIRLNKYSGRDSYKLLFSGKYNNIRYSFGGSFGSQTDYLQLSKADIKVEYLFNPNFLIRLEQKNPIIESSTEEKVQELGLKYKFEF